MSDRPSQLVIIVKDGIPELFSSHYVDHDAENMCDRLAELGANVHVIVVPEVEGVTKATGKPVKPAPATAEPFAPVKSDQASAVAQPPIVTRIKSQEEFAEETRAMMEGGGNGMWRDADAPLNEGGAIS